MLNLLESSPSGSDKGFFQCVVLLRRGYSRKVPVRAIGKPIPPASRQRRHL